MSFTIVFSSSPSTSQQHRTAGVRARAYANLGPIMGMFALVACTDIEGIRERLEADGGADMSGQPADVQPPTFAGSGGATAGTIGASGASGAGGMSSFAGSGGSNPPGPESGSGGSTPFSMAGQGGSQQPEPACVPGSEGCGCDGAGLCASGLSCVSATCMPERCGNGVQESAEACDDANLDDTDACTSACAVARCGDGFVHTGSEECDDGNGVDGDSCDNACLKHYNVAFVTSSTYTVGSLGGATGADAACNARAAAAGLPGNFVAWMHSDEASIEDRLGAARGFVRPDGKPFLDEYTASATFYPPSLNELGVSVTSSTVPAAGAYATNDGGGDCVNWTSSSTSEYLLVGDPSGGSGDWNGSWSSISCAATFRIYCLQKDFTNVLTFEKEEGRLAFITNSPWFPSGGLSAADAQCNQDARESGISGNFKALLGTSSASAASRFSTSGARWVRVDGIPLSETAADLFEPGGVLLAPLQVTPTLLYVGNYGGWSGGADPTQVSSASCENWTSASSGAMGTSGRVFLSRIEEMLGLDVDNACDSEYTHLYCLEE